MAKKLLPAFVSLIMLLSAVAFAEEPATLMIAEQGMFSASGIVTQPVEGEYDATTNWLDATCAGNTAHVDHANVLYQIPANDNGNPIVYLHGCGQSRMGWMTTPDGREGWATMFLRNGHSTYLVDQPGRGEAGAQVSMTTDGFLDVWAEDSKDYKPGDQTGNKSIFITHSQGGAVGWDVPVENMSAIIAIEPGGTPQVGSEQYQRLLEANIPIAIYFGDYIDNGPEEIQSTAFWKGVRDGTLEFAEHYNADGGDCTVVDLPKEGITGNSHFMFQEMNNQAIADHIEAWLGEHGLN